MWRLTLAILGAAAVFGLPPAATGASGPTHATPEASAATVDLTAHRIRIADHPGFVRVVVDFADGTLGSNDSEAADPDPFPDGRVSVDVRHRRIQAQAQTRSAHGVSARITQASNRVRIRLRARPGRFKYLHRFQLGSPERVVLDLYKSRPPVAGAEIAQAPDRCLTLEPVRVEPGLIRTAGRARFLFENSFQLIVRGARGTQVGDRIVTVGESGRWRQRVSYEIARRQAGTVEAVALSARDGALDCLVQTRVRLRP